jgi:hypothetical protein
MPIMMFVNPAGPRRKRVKRRTFTLRGRSVAPAGNPSSRRKKTTKRKATQMPAKKKKKKSSVGGHYHTGGRGYAAGMAAWSPPKPKAKKKRKGKAKKAKAYGPMTAKQEKALIAKRRRAGKKAARTRAANLRKKGRRAPKRKRVAARRRRSYTRVLGRARRVIKQARSGKFPKRLPKRARKARVKYVTKYAMMTNPRRRRRKHSPRRKHTSHRRSYRRNGLGGEMMSVVKTALPVAASLYLTRFIINKISPMIPGLDKLGTFSKPAVSAGMVVAAHFGTKKGPLSKWRDGILMGTGLNLIDSLVGAFAPADVKAMFGLADAGLYDRSLSEYVETGDYLRVGATPIDDDIALSDYVTVNGIEEELGMLEQELGVEEDLGDDRLGGVSQSSMLKQIPGMSFEAPVPTRSFTRQVPHAGSGYDNSNLLYTGSFAGGLGR